MHIELCLILNWLRLMMLSLFVLRLVPAAQKLVANQVNLKKAWDASQRSTKEDWAEWMRGFSIELLKESEVSPAGARAVQRSLRVVLERAAGSVPG